MIAIIFISLSLSENWWLMFGTIWRRCGNKSSKNSQKIHFWEPQKTRVNYGLIEKISFICFSSPVSYWNTLNSFNGSCLVTMKWSQFMYDEMKWSFNHNNKGSCWDVVVETIVKGIYHIWKKKKICTEGSKEGWEYIYVCIYCFFVIQLYPIMGECIQSIQAHGYAAHDPSGILTPFSFRRR